MLLRFIHVRRVLESLFSLLPKLQENEYVETSGEYLEKEFGISVSPEQVKLDGRVLPAP